MQVRVENLYYLLCYAWNCLEARSLVPVGSVTGPEPERLFARVFITAVEQLLKQRLDRGYIEREEDTSRPRGKLNIGTTLGRGLLRRGLVAAIHDELTEDVLHNRLVKKTARLLSRLDRVESEQRARLRAIVGAMEGVTDFRPASADFRRVQLHSNIRRYGFVLHLCELIHRCTLIDQQTGRLTFQSFAGNEQQMGTLFEAFLRSWLRTEQRRFPEVAARQVPWALEGDDACLLPTMQTDIMLRRAGACIVLEAKCYRSPVVVKYGGHPVLQSKDVYQLLSYLANQQVAHPTTAVAGALVYAVDQEKMPRARFSLLGYPLHVVPINLNRHWQEIDRAIRALVDELADQAPSEPAEAGLVPATRGSRSS